MDYTSLIAAKGAPGSIANWINFSDALLPLSDVLGDAQALIYDSLRVSHMRALHDIAIAAGASVADLPASTLDIVAVWDDGNRRLHARDVVSLQNARAVEEDGGAYVEGKPATYSLFGDKLQFDCRADADYTYRLMAYCIPQALGPGNATNFLTTRWPTLLRTACLAIAADWTNDDARYQRFLQRLQPLIQQANASDERALHGMVADVDYSRSYLP